MALDWIQKNLNLFFWKIQLSLFKIERRRYEVINWRWRFDELRCKSKIQNLKFKKWFVMVNLQAKIWELKKILWLNFKIRSLTMWWVFQKNSYFTSISEKWTKRFMWLFFQSLESKNFRHWKKRWERKILFCF